MSFAVHFIHSSFSPSADVKPMQCPFSANLFYLCMHLDLLGLYSYAIVRLWAVSTTFFSHNDISYLKH